MNKWCIFSKNGPPAQGPYSHAVAAGNLLFVSGQGPVAPDGSGVMKGSLEDEVRLTLTNLKMILEDAGSGLQHVVKVNVYLADMNSFSEFNEIYKEYLPQADFVSPAAFGPHGFRRPDDHHRDRL